MGCGLSRPEFKVQKTVVVEILTENQARGVSGVTLVNLSHQGKKIKFYYKPLYNNNYTKS